MISNQRYFERRAFEEAARANRARSQAAQLWHLELAEKYERLARGEAVDVSAERTAVA